MSSSSVRVRFAPSPTGIMHIGNLRTALLNYLFAKQKNGTLVLRIEDTDPQRNFDVGGKQIIADLDWMHIVYNEGPGKGGPYAPYFQSKRLPIYQEKLEELKKNNFVYPCFCSQETLDKQRERQKALKMPPRYDRTCMQLTKEDVEKRFSEKLPFIWRFKLDHSKTIEVKDLARGSVKFDLKNFSDFPLTRTDGSFTFMFANFVDDLTMKINYVFRGEDHLSNTAGQAAMYEAFKAKLPIFYHMSLLCNIDGKKLSKRDFGFSLHDLRAAGFLPEAINNYLGIIGASYKEEIMDLDQLAKTVNFEHSHAGKIKYDVEKLRWVNHKWIQRISPDELAERTKPFLIDAYPQAEKMDNKLADILQVLKMNFYVLTDAVKELKFYFEKPKISKTEIEGCVSPEFLKPIQELIGKNLSSISDSSAFLTTLKSEAKEKSIPIKQLFWFLRLALMGEVNGPSIHDLITILGASESKKRIDAYGNPL